MYLKEKKEAQKIMICKIRAVRSQGTILLAKQKKQQQQQKLQMNFKQNEVKLFYLKYSTQEIHMIL